MKWTHITALALTVAMGLAACGSEVPDTSPSATPSVPNDTPVPATAPSFDLGVDPFFAFGQPATISALVTHEFFAVPAGDFSIPDPGEFSVRFTEDELTITAGCRSLRVPYTIHEGVLTLGDPAEDQSSSCEAPDERTTRSLSVLQSAPVLSVRNDADRDGTQKVLATASGVGMLLLVREL